jgi:UDP:flavonoid glycosyltransferase YjiC (YdhE family)
MAKMLLAWEAGAYLGHEMLVTCAGVLLRKAGHEVIIVAPHGTAENHAARNAGIRWETFSVNSEDKPPPTGVAWESRATILWKFGFHSSDVIADRFRAWDALLHREQPDVVVLQAAPFAQLAAHAGGYPSVEFGIGYDVPPRHMPFPAFRNAKHFDVDEAMRLEAAVVQRISDAIGSGFAAKRSLCELVSGRARVVTSIPELDHYDGVDDSSRRFIGPLPIVPLEAERIAWRPAKIRLLAYVRAEMIDAQAFLRAVADAKSATGDALVVCMGADERVISNARALGVRLRTSPIAIAELLPQADVVISHGGGLMCEAAIRGRPCMALPSHFEQFLTATTLQRRKLGVVVNPKEPAHYGPALQHVLANAEIRREAEMLARRHRSTLETAGASFVGVVASIQEVRR